MLTYIKRYINSIPMKSEFEINALIKKCSFISFDIFDTLIKRTCGSPFNLFLILAKEYNNHFNKDYDLNKFAELRKEAESKARKAVKRAGKSEIAIEDIYCNFPKCFSSEELLWLQNREVELEVSLAHSNLEIIPYYEICRKEGKTISLISDMYLSEHVIRNILDKCGIDGYSKLLVSSTFDAQKTNGALFERYLSEIQAVPKDCLHIGDSFISDYLQSLKLGINVVRIPKYSGTARFTRTRHLYDTNAEKWRILQEIQESNMESSWDDYYCFGYECLGPFLYGICKWMYEDVTKNGIEKLFFFSRDGYILKKVFDSLYPETLSTEYLYVSRRSMTVPQYCINPGLEAFQKLSPPNVVWNYKNLADEFLIDTESSKCAWIASGFSEDDYVYNYNLLNDERMNRYYGIFRDKIIEKSKESFDLVFTYLLQNGIDNTKSAIFDMGWRGTTQKCIESILDAGGINSQIKGYYVGLVKDSFEKLTAETFFTPGSLPNIACAMMFDLFFTAPEGSVRCYEKNNDNILKPVLNCCEYNETELALLERIIAGTVDFASVMKECGEIVSIPNKDYALKIFDICRYPKKHELEMFENFTFTDKATHKMVSSKGRLTYLRNPTLLYKDFLEAGWKIGFVKKLFGFSLPFFCFELMFKSDDALKNKRKTG